MLQNPIFLSVIFSAAGAQFIKAIISLCRRPRQSIRELGYTLLWRTGGMPSSHSSVVVALATSVGFQEGYNSTLFFLALFMSLIVIRDAMGVRHSSGVQGRTLNLLGKALNARFQIEFQPVKEVSGHKPIEVAIGGLLGFFIALAFATL